jgi:hypothetical protein
MCHEGQINKIKSIKKVKDQYNNRINAEVKYLDCDGNKRGTAFLNFEKNFEEKCDECGRKKYRCKLEKCEYDRTKPKQTDKPSEREKTDVTDQYT